MPGKDDDGNHVFAPEYRLLFPFEDDPETEGMWWELDHHWKRWRTVSWRVYDPEHWEDRDNAEAQIEYHERNELETAAEDVTDITTAFSDLTFNDLGAQPKDDIRSESESGIAAEDIANDRRVLSSTTANADGTWDQRRLLFDSHCVCNFLQEAREGLCRGTGGVLSRCDASVLIADLRIALRISQLVRAWAGTGFGVISFDT